MTNYLHTHSAAQMWRRLTYGMTSLSRLAIEAPYFKYFVIAICALLVLSWRNWTGLIGIVKDQAFASLFTLLCLFAYATAYSWYAAVSYGDRYILSLFLPLMFCLTWLCARLGEGLSVCIKRRSLPVVDSAAMVLTVLLLVEGAAMATIELPRPNEHFVEFYFNESREAFLSGDIQAGTEGYRGAIELDPAFAPAHHELAIVALQSARLQEALQPAKAAAELAPGNANYLNTYGSALLQVGDLTKAVEVLEQAVLADPRFASAWYNLGVAHATAGQMEDASRVVEELTRIDPQAASRLRAFIEQP
jgi:tetratricopeptide (TPR) repeat protein